MKRVRILLVELAICAFVLWTSLAGATSILFVGNSFTYGYGSPVRYFHANSVTDLNHEGVGGVPALFKAFTVAAGLDYDVSLETHGDVGLDWHLENKGAVIGERPWDIVVLQTFSVLDPRKPGDPARLIRSAQQMTEWLGKGNPATDVRIVATWPRADMVYGTRGPWQGKSVDTMALDIRTGIDRAAAAVPAIKGVVPVGEAWVRAIRSGVADANPYDGIDAGKVDLWARDYHHASTFGYYLDGLMIFGAITGRDPRSLGEDECAGVELELSAAQVAALQRVAFEQLAAAALLGPTADRAGVHGNASPCPR